MKDYDAIAREIYIPSIFSTPEWNGAEIQRITAILRKHDEAEEGGEQYNRPADILAHLKDYPGARDRLIDLLANECWPRSFVADCFAKYDEIQSRPAPTDEKALREMFLEWIGGRGPCSGTYCRLCPHEHDEHPISLPSSKAAALIARKAPKDESK